MNCVSEAPTDGPTGERREHRLHVIGLEPAQGDALERRVAIQLSQSGRQRVRTVDLDVAIVQDYEQPGAHQPAGKVDEEIERSAVGPVQVLETDHQRLGGGDSVQEIAKGLIQPPAVRFGIAWEAWRHCYAI